MTPMDRETIEKHDIAQRYLHGKLSPEESEAFEIYVMEHPELIEMLELDRVFMANADTIKVPVDKRAHKESFWQRLLRQPLYVGVSTATACMLCFTLVLQLGGLPLQESSPDIGTSALVYLEAKRSNQAVKPEVIRLGNNEKTVVLVVSVPDSLNQEYSVEIRQAGGGRVFQLKGFGNEYGDVVVSVPAHALGAGVYRLEAKQEQEPQARLVTQFEVIIM